MQSIGHFDGRIISTGRDGTLRFHRIQSPEGLLNPLHRRKIPIEWASRCINSENDTFILGFKEIEFMIYSARFDRLIMRIVCGGGHRSWDCLLENEVMKFVCIKDRQVHGVKSSCKSSETVISGMIKL